MLRRVPSFPLPPNSFPPECVTVLFPLISRVTIERETVARRALASGWAGWQQRHWRLAREAGVLTYHHDERPDAQPAGSVALASVAWVRALSDSPECREFALKAAQIESNQINSFHYCCRHRERDEEENRRN